MKNSQALKNTPKSLFDGFIGKLLLTWGIASLILMFAFRGAAPIIFGQCIALYGFVILHRHDEENRTLGKFLVFMGCVSILGGMFLEPDLINILMFVSVFFFFGVHFALINPLSRKRRKKRCTEAVTAKIIDIGDWTNQNIYYNNGRQSDYSMSATTYEPVFQYDFGGNKYKVKSSFTSLARPTFGGEKKLYINPNNPTEFYDIELENEDSLAAVVLGIIAITASIIFYIMLFLNT